MTRVRDSLAAKSVCTVFGERTKIVEPTDSFSGLHKVLNIYANPDCWFMVTIRKL